MCKIVKFSSYGCVLRLQDPTFTRHGEFDPLSSVLLLPHSLPVCPQLFLVQTRICCSRHVYFGFYSLIHRMFSPWLFFNVLITRYGSFLSPLNIDLKANPVLKLTLLIRDRFQVCSDEVSIVVWFTIFFLDCWVL